MKYPYVLVKKSFHTREPWINVFLFKHITIPLVYLMVNFTKITPNIISILSLFFGLCSAYFYWNGNVMLGGLMYLISYIFDATDGKVARITKTGKPYGAWFDIAIDRINLVFISMAIAYNYYLNNNTIILILLNCIFLGLTFIGSESRYQIDLYKLKNNVKDKLKASISPYEKWCESKGLINEPISLPEIFLFYMIVSPQMGIEKITLLFVLLMLVIRIFKQQFFWAYVDKNK